MKILTLLLCLYLSLSAAAQITRRDASVPEVPDPGPITRDLTTHPVRVFFDYNPTPVFKPNPKYTDDGKHTEPDRAGRYAYLRVTDDEQYMKKLGFAPAFVVYNGTLNRAKTWANDDGQPRLARRSGNRFNLDWSRDGDFSTALDPLAIKACALLARKPWTFGADLRPRRPIFIDIEGTKTYNNPDPKPRMRLMLDTLNAWRAEIGKAQELYWYDGQNYIINRDQLAEDPELAALEEKISRRLTGFCCNFYNWDMPAETGGESWFAAVDVTDGIINKYYPQWVHSKVGFVSPYYQIYWPKNAERPDLMPKNGELIPMELWQRQIRYMVDRRWHIFVWGAADLEKTRAYLDYVATFRG